MSASYRLGRRDFQGADLRGRRLAGVALSDVDLRGAELSGTDLSGVDLRGAKLHSVNAGPRFRSATALGLLSAAAVVGLSFPIGDLAKSAFPGDIERLAAPLARIFCALIALLILREGRFRAFAVLAVVGALTWHWFGLTSATALAGGLGANLYAAGAAFNARTGFRTSSEVLVASRTLFLLVSLAVLASVVFLVGRDGTSSAPRQLLLIVLLVFKGLACIVLLTLLVPTVGAHLLVGWVNAMLSTMLASDNGSHTKLFTVAPLFGVFVASNTVFCLQHPSFRQLLKTALPMVMGFALLINGPQFSRFEIGLLVNWSAVMLSTYFVARIVEGDRAFAPFVRRALRLIRSEYACFRRADLEGCDFEGAALGASDFSEANLRGAKLASRTLIGAQFVMADLEGADLHEADLTWADLRDANLKDVRLRGARLFGADLRGANLVGVDLTGADLRWADLRHATMERTTFRDTRDDYAELPDDMRRA